MNNDYLWDKSGPVDPEIERLEQLLRPLGHNPAQPLRNVKRPRRPRWPWAAAAAAVVAAAGLWLARPAGPVWTVVALAGDPHIGSRDMASRARRLRIGEWLETDAASKAQIALQKVGELEVEPNTRLRILRSGSAEHRIALEQGKVHATIWAPPHLFYVNTPSAVAIDLGCAYTMSVDAAGDSTVEVTKGYVAVDSNGREALIPSGALCVTRKNGGPGTPHFADAAPEFLEALDRFDRGDQAALAAVLAAARPQDAISLWHLVGRTAGPARAQVVDRLAGFVAPPADAPRDNLLRADQAALAAWWDLIHPKRTGHGPAHAAR